MEACLLGCDRMSGGVAMKKSFSNYTESGEWDFRDANTKEYTHSFHIYPAMMIPQIARELGLAIVAAEQNET